MKTITAINTKLILILLIIGISGPQLFAQESETTPDHRSREGRWDKLKSMKIAYITQELNLTPAEAEKFWPLYNEFEAKRDEIASNLLQSPQRGPTDFDRFSDEEVSEMISLKFKEERAMVDLREEYNEKYKKVLPIKKIARYYESEKKFRSHLLHQIRDGNYRNAKSDYMRRRGDN